MTVERVQGPYTIQSRGVQMRGVLKAVITGVLIGLILGLWSSASLIT